MTEDFQRKYALLREAIVLALVQLEAVGQSSEYKISRVKTILEAALDGSGIEGLEAGRIIGDMYKELHPERLQSDTTTEFDHRPSAMPMTEKERDSADMVWDYPDKKERE